MIQYGKRNGIAKLCSISHFFNLAGKLSSGNLADLKRGLVVNKININEFKYGFNNCKRRVVLIK